MHIHLLIKGLIIGFSIAAPVGPIGVLCINRTLTGGRTSGFISGLGAATADAVYGSVAGFGLTFISNILISHQIFFHITGGIILSLLGVRIFLIKPSGKASSTKENGLLSDYISTFFLTLSNPATIISFAAVFAGLGLASVKGNYLFAGIFITGIFLGSSFWWLFLSFAVGLFRTKFNPHGFQWINRISGIIITCLGFISLISLKGY